MLSHINEQNHAISETKNRTKGSISSSTLAFSNDAIYSSRRSTGTTIHPSLHSRVTVPISKARTVCHWPIEIFKANTGPCYTKDFWILPIKPVRTCPGPHSMNSVMPSAIMFFTLCVQRTGEVNCFNRFSFISWGSICGKASTF